ncbi:hypothetical protein [Pectobacterium versatile]|uniref:hypothetical protein n=1 Tax=Pectobacterium versatile TaxID=2488639 RepID=UPI001F3B40AA|nr:hypothetical protein [Pectobacterium versatile]
MTSHAIRVIPDTVGGKVNVPEDGDGREKKGAVWSRLILAGLLYDAVKPLLLKRNHGSLERAGNFYLRF